MAKPFFFGPLEPIRARQCRCLDLIVPKPPCWPIRPTLHIRRNSNDPRESLPVPGMWVAPVSVAERERKFLTVGTVVVKPEEVKTAEDEARESLPMPGMRQTSTGAYFRSVRLGDAEG